MKKEEAKRPFTADQVKGIKQILASKQKGDLYGIFGLEKSCSDSELKKAYRKVFAPWILIFLDGSLVPS
jgi:hypothetical protein